MPARKVAFVTGVTGQDGAHLAHRLLEDGWTVYGGFLEQNLAYGLSRHHQAPETRRIPAW